jgi:adenosine 3'-phospho 5'-phosphosulfate transporter B3
MESKQVRIYCLPIGSLSRPVQLVICSIGIFTCFCLYALVQEFILKSLRFTHGFAWTLYQCVAYATFATVERTFLEGTPPLKRSAPISLYSTIALFSMLTMSLSNEAAVFLNYPTFIMFKSSKLIPIMLGGFFINGMTKENEEEE